jgi:hypothetical protein
VCAETVLVERERKLAKNTNRMAHNAAGAFDFVLDNLVQARLLSWSDVYPLVGLLELRDRRRGRLDI